MKTPNKLVIVCLAFLPAMTAAGPERAAPPVTPAEAHEIGVKAYLYFYPLVIMDVTRRQCTNIEAGKIVGRGPMNTFVNMRSYPPADFKEVIRPNFDTLYSIAWLDLTREPVIVSAPDTGGRYYLLPMMDMWTDVFASPGKRTTGTQAGRFAVVGPGWRGTLPAGVERINSPTPYVWIIGRTQTDGPKDYAAVHKVQDGYTATPLSQLGRGPRAVSLKIDPTVDMKTAPVKQVNAMPPDAFFRYAAELVKLHPPHATDQPIVARMKRIGLEVGKSFDMAKLEPAIADALRKAAADALKAMSEKTPTMAPVRNGWLMNIHTMGVYGNHYLKRAIVAMIGLGANVPADAVYPLSVSDATGKALTGENKYVLRFAKEDVPPVGAFWSITVYDNDGFPVANSLNRHAVSSWMPLEYQNGSLTIYIQSESPGNTKESNWLPAPKGPFSLAMRLYAPKLQVLGGRWNPPPVERAN